MTTISQTRQTLPTAHLDHDLSLRLSEGHELPPDVAGVDDPVLLRAGVLDDHDRPVQHGLDERVPLLFVSRNVQAFGLGLGGTRKGGARVVGWRGNGHSGQTLRP